MTMCNMKSPQSQFSSTTFPAAVSVFSKTALVNPHVYYLHSTKQQRGNIATSW